MQYVNPLITVLAPTYNEAKNIEPLIAAIFEAIPYPTEIIVVDDNSPDGTWEVVEKLSTQNPNIRIERRMSNRGLTRSLRRGIELAKGNIIVWMDCDFSMPPTIIPLLLREVMHNKNDIAVGSRFIAGGKQKKSDRTDEQSALQWAWIKQRLPV